jgi:hypothetical protein
MMTEAYRHGDFLASCDRCGRKFPGSELRQEWTGLRVCRDDWDPRHSQDLKRGKPEHQGVPFARLPSAIYLEPNDVQADDL